MSDVKEKHPTWFKMKIERRQLVKQLEPKTAVNVLLACWDYLETGEYPTNLSALEQIACCAARNRLLKRTTQTDNRQSLLSSLLLLTMRTNT